MGRRGSLNGRGGGHTRSLRNAQSALGLGPRRFESNRGHLIAQGNRVGSKLQVFSNRGGATLNSNRINGNLQCKNNNPAPQGSSNQASSKEDQRAGL